MKLLNSLSRGLRHVVQGCRHAIEQWVSPVAPLESMVMAAAYASQAHGVAQAAPMPRTQVVVQRALNGRKPGQLELVVVDDGTLSSVGRAEVMATITEHLTQGLRKALAQVSYGYIVSRDRQEGEHDEWRVVQGTAEQVLREQALVIRAGGGDAAECFADTLMEVIDRYPFTYSQDVVRVVLLVCTDDTKPTLHGLDAAQVGQALADRRTHLVVAGEPHSNTRDLVSSAGRYGLMFWDLSAQPTPEALAKVTAGVTSTVVGTVSSGGTVPMAGASANTSANTSTTPTGQTVPNP